MVALKVLFRKSDVRLLGAQALGEDGPAAVVPGQGEPGTVVFAGRDGVDVACGQNCLRLLEVQLPGGRRISGADFSNSQNPQGVRLAPVGA